MKLARRSVTTLSQLLALIVSGCAQAPPLTISLDHHSIAADGTSLIHVTARARDPIEGAVVQFAADGGALAASSVPLTNGSASVDL
ncbi:MAG TPA: Ig-like domain-containing protein, partial [Myxococcota bacterium]